MTADDARPVVCAFVERGPRAAHDVSLLTGLTVADASLLVEDHLVRGQE